MRIIFFAALLAFLFFFQTVQPSYADWKDSLVRAVATPLVNRAMNYLFDRPRSTATKSTRAVKPPPTVPPKKTYSVPVPSTSSAPVEIPPPPKTMVPPPPPGVPTGAILGMYPQEFNQVEPPAILYPKPEKKKETPMPKLAPDFRKPEKKK